MDNEQRLRLLKIKAQAQAKLNAANQTNGASVSPEEPGFFGGIGARLHRGVDQITEDIGQTLETYGAPEWGQSLRNAVQGPSGPSDSEQFMNMDGEGFGWDHLPGAVVEQSPQYAGSKAAALGGAAAGSTFGPVGTLVGGAAGAASFGIAQQAGQIAEERARNNGRAEPNWVDKAVGLGTGAVSGVVDALTFKGAGGILTRTAKEGLTEATQSVIEQTGSTAGTERGLEISAKQAIGEGILGATGATAVETSTAGARAIKNIPETTAGIRWDENRNTYDENDVELARRIRATEYGQDLISNVSDTGGSTSAQGVAKTVLSELRDEAKVIVSELKQQAKTPEAIARVENMGRELDGLDALIHANPVNEIISDLNVVMGQSRNLKANISDRNIDRIGRAFPDNPQAERLTGLLRQIQKIRPFTEAKGDLGGLNRFTRLLDPLDGRSGVGKVGFTLHGLAGPTGLASLAGGIALNRAARGIDNLTNQRSTVKRYTESVERAVKKGLVEDRTNLDRVAELRRLVAEAQAKRQAQTDQQAQQQAQAAQQGQPGPTSAWNPAQAVATKRMFQSGEIPENTFYEPYRLWKQATGLDPKKTLDALMQLEQQGVVPEGTARRFVQEPRSFDTNKDEVYQIQQAVREKFNPTYSDIKVKAAQASDPNSVLRKLDLSKVGLHGNRRVTKAREGELTTQQVRAQIEAARDRLDATTYGALHKLRTAMDVAGMTDSMREDLMKQTLGGLFTNPVDYDHWYKTFIPLAAIGNNYAINAHQNADPDENFRETRRKIREDHEKRETKRKKAKRKPKAASTPAPANSPEAPTPSGPGQYPFSDSKINSIMEKLAKGPEANPETDTESSAETKVIEDQEPKPSERVDGEKPKKKGTRNSIKDTIQERVDSYHRAVEIAKNQRGRLEDRLATLGRSTEGRVEAIIYDLGTSRITSNLLIDSFASKFNVPAPEAARMVMDVLDRWEQAGLIKMYFPAGSNLLKHDSAVQKDADGKTLKVLQIEILDPDFKDTLEVAKAVHLSNSLVSQTGPRINYAPGLTQDGDQTAFKDYKSSEVDESFAPLLNIINDLRNTPMGVSETMMRQIEKGLEGSGTNMPIRDWLEPVVGKTEARNKKGEIVEKDSRDKSGIYAVGQLLFQLGQGDARTSSTFYQEWFAGANGRIYSKNGQAHTQGGDLMKGLIRSATKQKVGGREGLDMMFHSFGNLLGFDKKSPKERRQAIFRPGYIKALLDFSKEPFGRTTFKTSTGKEKLIAKIVDDGEGPFQVLNVANEIASMVAWAGARHKKLARDPEKLLTDPAVQQDIADNYETDFIVQLDASNNAYQLAGLLLGDEAMMRATGIAPRPGVTDPDDTPGADIYLEPAKIVASRTPELKALMDAGLPDSALRKIFKKPIGTYLYATAFQSRNRAIKTELEKLAGKGVPVFKVGDAPGLIPVPAEVLSGLSSPEGHVFVSAPIGPDGEPLPPKTVRRRVRQDGDLFIVDSDDSKRGGKWKPGGAKFDTFEKAVAEAYGRDFYNRVDRALIAEFESQYPAVKQYLDFAATLSQQLKAAGKDHVLVPTPDGITLKYSFKEKPSFGGMDIQRNGKTERIGFTLPETKITGRGLAAFMTHQIDAYVLRESYRRLGGRVGLNTFNPIHDSYGFHPADAAKGRDTVLQVMQEMGNPDFNMFLSILEANGVKVSDFLANGGVMPDRKGIQPVGPRMIPTALS